MRAAALRTYRVLLEAAWVRGVAVGPVDDVLRDVDRDLRASRITFGIAGGFAVIEHGYERFTKNIDLLVLDTDVARAMRVLRSNGFEGGRTKLGARMRHARRRVQVQLLRTVFEGDERAIIRREARSRRLSVIPVEHLVLMKLETGLLKDEADIVELLKARASSTKIARYLRETFPELLRASSRSLPARVPNAFRPRAGPRRSDEPGAPPRERGRAGPTRAAWMGERYSGSSESGESGESPGLSSACICSRSESSFCFVDCAFAS
jgi:hypothetical protein